MIVLRPGVPKLRIDELAFSPDGSTVAAPAGARGILLWANVTSASKSEVLAPPVRVVSRLAFAPDGRTLYAGKDQLCAFDLASREGARLEIPSWAALHFGVSPDATRLCVAENPQGTEHTRLTCWDATALGAPSHEVVTPSLVYSPPLFAPDGGSFVLVEGFRLPSRLWEFRRVTRSPRTGAVLEQSDPLPGYPEQTVRSPDGRTLACRTYDVISFYPAEGPWADVPRVANDSKKHFTGIAYHPSGRFLAATSNDKTVKLYDTTTWAVAKTYTWDVGRMRSVAFSPDGTLAAAGSDTGKVVVWDVDA